MCRQLLHPLYHPNIMNKSKPPIYIIGAGAIGKALAVFLHLEGRHVTLIRGSIDDGSAGSLHIPVELPEGNTVEAEVPVSTLRNFKKFDGIILLTNKSFGNADLAAMLRPRSGDSPVVVLQNGLNVEQPFIDHGFPGIYRCVLLATSQQLSSGILKFRPVAASPVGIIRGDDQKLAPLISGIDNLYFPFVAETDIQPRIWTKAIVNSVFNSICPLLETDNGIFHRNATALALAMRVITECIAVAAGVGVHLEKENITDTLLMISKASDGQLISTYQDIINRRRTEIGTLNLAIVEIAGKLGKENAVKETKLLGELTSLKAATRL